MISKSLFYCVFQLLTALALGQAAKAKAFVDPTGTYKLPYTVQGNDVYGPFGEVRAKLIPGRRVVVCLFICRGWPDYNNGDFLDTLSYSNNTVVHRTPEEDSTCRITLVFKNNCVEVDQRQENLNFGCGFGQGAFADGEYQKVSKRVPSMNDIERDYFPIEKLIARQGLKSHKGATTKRH